MFIGDFLRIKDSVYIDDGFSGTNTEHRQGFQKLMADAMDRKIDLIITKAVSRFARNLMDCIVWIEALQNHDPPVRVYFEKESINTMDSKGELLLTIMASLAQQESQSLSRNVKLGLQFRYQQGQVQVNHNRFLGYTKDANGHLIIDPVQAEVVRRIYREYLEGYTIKKIAEGLEADGILTGTGGKRWYFSTIKRVLSNEKYIGDALLQKTYSVDFLTKKRVKNTGIVPQYYVENSHEAIIPKEIYQLVQQEMAHREKIQTSLSGSKRTYSGKHCFSQIVYCGECGEVYRRVY